MALTDRGIILLFDGVDAVLFLKRVEPFTPFGLLPELYKLGLYAQECQYLIEVSPRIFTPAPIEPHVAIVLRIWTFPRYIAKINSSETGNH